MMVCGIESTIVMLLPFHCLLLCLSLFFLFLFLVSNVIDMEGMVQFKIVQPKIKSIKSHIYIYIIYSKVVQDMYIIYVFYFRESTILLTKRETLRESYKNLLFFMY